MKRQPFEEGWDAGLRGYTDPRVICPYDKMTKEWREWHAFYKRAVELRADKQKEYAAAIKVLTRDENRSLPNQGS